MNEEPHHVVIVVLSNEPELNARIVQTINRFAPQHAAANSGMRLEVECTNDQREAFEKLDIEHGHASLIMGLEGDGNSNLAFLAEVSRKLPHVEITSWGEDYFAKEVMSHGAHFVSRCRHAPPTARIAGAALRHMQKIGRK